MKKQRIVRFCRAAFSRFLIFVCLFAATLLTRDWLADWKNNLAVLAFRICMGIS